jgi:hypothetical protein
MTTEQVPLAEQIAAVHDEVEKWSEFASAHPKMTPGERDLAARELEMWRAVLASLSDLDTANERIARLEGALRGIVNIDDGYAAAVALAALSPAGTVTATPAGKAGTIER